jgi:hypothetical protein
MARCRATHRRSSFVLVTKDQPPFFQIIGRYFDRHAIAGEGLDPVLLHSAGGVGDKRVTVVELYAVACVRQYLDHQTLKLQEFFFSHADPFACGSCIEILDGSGTVRAWRVVEIRYLPSVRARVIVPAGRKS